MKKRRIILLWLFAGMLLVPGCTLKNAEASSENQSDTATNSEEQTVKDIQKCLQTEIRRSVTMRKIVH